MSGKYKVSVIIPVYSVSDYIERCAESLFSQTLDAIQFVFVDDASPDDSVAKLEQTLERFPHRKVHTRILRQPSHQGTPAARAAGLALAEAPYVIHCDSDDFLEPDMCEKLYEAAIREQADMVICDNVYHHPDGTQSIERYNRTSTDDSMKDFLFGITRRTVSSRLTRTDLYRKVVFPTDSYLEDWVQVAQLVVLCPRCAYLPEPLYHQVYNPKSITRDRRLEVMEEKIRQCKSNFAIIHDFIMDRGLAEEGDFIVLKNIVRSRYYPLLTYFRRRKDYLNTFPELNKAIFSSPHIGRYPRIAHICILLGIFPLTYPLFNFIKHHHFSGA